MMKYIALISLLMFGCAHGAQLPDGMDESSAAAQAAQQDVKLDDTAAAATSSVKAAAQDQAANLAGNAAMAKAIAAEVLRRMPLIADQKSLLYFNQVGQYMAQELVPSLKCRTDGTAPADVRIAIVKSANPAAFSLPAGLIFVTTGLVQKMNSEDEFAGVLANEMASSICGKGVPSNLALQAASGWSEYIGGLPTKPLSKADLMFSDRYALVTLYRRGYDITPYVIFVAKNEVSGRHGFGAERAAQLQKSVAATPPISPTSSARAGRWKAAKTKAI